MNVLEVDGTAGPAITAAPTSVAAFVGLTERGPADRPVRLTGPAQFRDRFGGYRPDGFLGYALDGFFLNGGTTAYVSRVVGADSLPASRTLQDRQVNPAAVLKVSAGYRGEHDPGPWGKRLRVDVADDPRITTALKSDTPANATTATLVSVDGIEPETVLRFSPGRTAAYRKVTAVDPAARTVTWQEPIAAALDSKTTTVATPEFRLTVSYRADPTGDHTTVENWRGLTMVPGSPDYAVARLNHPVSGSRYLLLTDLTADTAGAGLGYPAPVTGADLSEEGTEADADAKAYTGDAAARTGLHALDTTEIQLLAVPDVHGLNESDRHTVVLAALDYCARRGDACFVGSAPDRAVRVAGTVPRAPADYGDLDSEYLETVVEYASDFHAAKVYGALYAPWIQVADPQAAGAAATRFVPADGHVLGLYARTDLERGIWKAPAGTAAQLRGALDTAARFTDRQHTHLVRDGLVNGVRPDRDGGIVVAASRTLSTDTRWWFVNVRLLFNYVESSLRDGLRFVRQEPHTERLRRSVRLSVVTPFLLGLWRQGAFGADPPEQVFTVKCDAENNPAAEVDQGNFRLEVYFYPVRPAETVTIVVGQQPSGGSAAEA
ncbi:phage tail sheath subtilisin-like domain-containing protein [Streptomyces palmae]|uniref:phage tail sheath subtilisin-like domain-containing protein n=1 Tax=Streptomyces palmae TaxID=1701085 RepID=UPI001432CF7B|nr:phage tail sheath subtilisin-like domain-containing protein [Streptomyces palmae]